MQRPLGGVVIFFVLGILLGTILSIALVVWLAAGFLACGLSLWARRGRGAWLAVLLIATGAAGITRHLSIISPVDVRKVISSEAELLALRGTVVRVDWRETESRQGETTVRALAIVRLAALQRRDQAWQPVQGDVLATTRAGRELELRAGQRVQLFGVVAPAEGAFAPGMFDYQAHLAWRGIHRTVEFEGARDLVVIKDAVRSWPERFQAWGRAALQRGLPAEDETVPLLWAMTLGWKTSLTDEVAEPFMRSGTMHLFAISGLHIGLISGILVALLRMLRVPRSSVGWLAVPALWFFVAATGWQASAVRATIMLSIVIGGWSLHRPVNLLNSLAAAALIILLWDPRELFHAGFQLSFAVVAGIAVVLPKLENWRLWLLRTDPMLPLELRPKWQQRLDGPLRFVTTSFAVSVAAWIGSLPLIMLYFHLVTPLGLFANVVVVQLGALALASAFGSLLTAPFVPVLHELFNHSAWFFARSMQETSLWFSELPAAWWYVKAPPLLCIAAYYAAVGLIASGRLIRRPRWAVPLLVGLLAVGAVSWHHTNHRPQLTVLPLNGGHAVCLEQAGGETWLIDCGNEGSYNFRVRPFLQSRGINRLAYLMLSHGDIRHVGGAALLIDEFQPARVYGGPQLHRSNAYRQLLEQLVASGRPLLVLTNGSQPGPWTILHPAADDRSQRADSAALVQQVEFAGRSMLFAPDLDAGGQRALIKNHPELRTQVLVTSLGTDADPVRTGWLQHVQPGQLIFADSNLPATDRVSPAHRQRLRELVPEVFFTSETGTIQFRESVGGLEVWKANNRPARHDPPAVQRAGRK